MKSTVTWHHIAEDLPEEFRLVLLAFFDDNGFQDCSIGRLIRLNEDCWDAQAKDGFTKLSKYNYWAYFTTPSLDLIEAEFDEVPEGGNEQCN